MRSIPVPLSDISNPSPVVWDVRDNTGTKLPGGVYLVQASGSRTNSKPKLVLLR
jgi:hypothetical protein